MKFGPSQRTRFESNAGAYSLVTDREFVDSQITATDYEAELLMGFFGSDNIQVGNVRSNPDKARKTFKLYPDGAEVNLNLVYPKPAKTELRLYLSERAGFKPLAESVWFIFALKNELWIGAMPENIWRNENQILIYDQEDGTYQDSLQELDEIKVNKLKSRDIFARDRNKALERMAESSYQCEFDTSHELFISYSSNMPYLEAHHLLPMSLQKETSVSLDIKENIFCLCPYCHRAIHHAEKHLVKGIIDKLVDNRPDVLNILNNNIDDVYNYYTVESIV